MQFCDDCDALLQPKDDNGKVRPYCPDCDEFKDGEVKANTIEVPDIDDRKQDPEGGKILIIKDDNKKAVGRSSKPMYCDNCESVQEVEYWAIQTRSADESPTRFFRCLTCDKHWREYD